MGTEAQNLIPELDREYLSEKDYRYELVQEQGCINVIIRDHAFPAAYQPRAADLLIRLPAGYPNSNPDMFWTSPDVLLTNGNWPQSSTHHEHYCGRSWQRWSRHFPDKTWRPGIDSLQTYLAAIRRELQKGI
jgi:hypothetical protein